MTAKQQAFCAEYLIDLNATKAAIRAGYSEQTAGSQGERMLKNVEIKTEIDRLMAERSERTELTADRIIHELSALAFYDPGAIGEASVNGPEDISKLPEVIRRAIVGWSWDKAGNFTLKLSAKIQALDLLGQHLKMWKSRVEISGPDGGPVQTEASDAQLRQGEDLAECLAEIRKSISDQATRKGLISMMPDGPRSIAEKMEAAAEIASTVEPPASFRGLGSEE